MRAKIVSPLWHQDDGSDERDNVQLGAIQIDVLRAIGGPFALGKQLGGGSAFGGTSAQVIERKLGMESPAEDGERQQKHRHTNGEMAGAHLGTGLVRWHHAQRTYSVYTKGPAEALQWFSR